MFMFAKKKQKKQKSGCENMFTATKREETDKQTTDNVMYVCEVQYIQINHLSSSSFSF
jgi:hypothetical protein